MNKQNSDSLKWIKNRLRRKYKIKPEVTENVLGAISDLLWDWGSSRFDLYGLGIEEILADLGKDRAPANKKDDCL